ncbi:MAG: dTDP-4-dehydrorhamnose reductase [Bacteroidetes bacterium]|nr:dTDP-4-dehydrorhamnose reductase [Bacteroidota bacterium]
MTKPLILVTGKDGQLGFELMQLSEQFNNQFNFLFVGRNELDLSNSDAIASFIKQHQPQYIVNCAAYTAVDKAETEQELAYAINATAPAVMAKVCAEMGCKLIHISTDYVFDGEKQQSYLPTDAIHPLNVYGSSKAAGEKLVAENSNDAVIIRTSWVYSSHGKNFVKAMLKLMSDRPEINVVADQIGCPTYAADLAEAIMKIICSNVVSTSTKIYHYSNTGNISWFQFAQAIQEIGEKDCKVNPIPSTAYPTPAKRSNYSVMDTSDIEKDFGVEIKDWKKSLEKCIHLL